MRVPGIIVARTDAESATFLENLSDERDQPFILGATKTDLPTYRVGYLAILKKLSELGVARSTGICFSLSPIASTAMLFTWIERVGLLPAIASTAKALENATPNRN